MLTYLHSTDSFFMFFEFKCVNPISCHQLTGLQTNFISLQHNLIPQILLLSYVNHCRPVLPFKVTKASIELHDVVKITLHTRLDLKLPISIQLVLKRPEGTTVSNILCENAKHNKISSPTHAMFVYQCSHFAHASTITTNRQIRLVG